MQKTRWSLVTLVSALVLVVPRVAGAEAKPIAIVQVALGSVFVQRSAAPGSVALAVRDGLYAGDVVRTGANGRASLLFSDGSQVRLGPKSTLEITPPTPSGKGKQSFLLGLAGELWARLRPGGAVRTRSTICAVRGTELHLRIDDHDATTLTVIEGEVEYSNPLGAVVVGESQESVAQADAPPSTPVTIANAALTIEWALDLERAAIPRERFYITPDRGSLGDQLEVWAERAATQASDPAVHRSYGEALFDNGQYEEALQEFQASDRLLPNDAATLTHIGDALLELEQMDEAAAAFQSALAADPKCVPAMVGQAWVELRHNRPAEAQAAAEGAVAADPASAEATVALGLALMRGAGNLAEAQKRLEAATQMDPPAYRYQAHAWAAMVRLAQDDTAAALQEAEEAAELAPQSALVHGNLALVYFFSGRPGRAEREARLATKLDPNSVAAECTLGQTLLAMGDAEGASRAAGRVVAMDPGLPEAHYLLGLSDLQSRSYKSAARELQHCLRLAPSFLPAASTLARVYDEMGRKSEAIAILRALLPQHPRSHEVLAALGAAYYRQSDFGAAIEQYQEALKLQPASALCHAELSRVLTDANRLNEAIEAGQEAVRLSPETGQYHAALGLAYDYSRLNGQAEREFREALALDPQNALARLALGLKTAQLGPREQRIFPKQSSQSLPDLLRQSQQAATSTAAVSTVTQAFMYDPAVSQQILRGGVVGELSLSGGNRQPLGGSLTRRAVGADGAFHSFAVGSRSEDEGSGVNDDVSTTSLSADVSYTAGEHTTWFARASHNGNEQGLSNPSYSWDVDDRADRRDLLLQLAARDRIGRDVWLWVGLSQQSQHLTITDDDIDSRWAPVYSPGLAHPIRASSPRQEVTTQNWIPELRLDIPLAHLAARPAVISLGVSRAALDAHSAADIVWQAGPPIELRSSDAQLDGSLLVGYLQLTQRVNDDLSFVAQLRRQRLHTRSTMFLGGQSTAAVEETESFWLPAVLVNCRTGRRDLVRLLYNHQAQEQELAPMALVPNEALMVTEPLVLPKGSLGNTRMAELEYERYLGADSFLKGFLFHAIAEDVDLGALPRMMEVKRTGLGVRYEGQLSPNLWMQAAYLYNRTDNETPFAPFDGGTAPYSPLHLAGVALNYVDQAGTKAGLQLNWTGRFFQDSGDLAAPARPSFAPRAYVDLMWAKEPSVRTEYFLKVSNVFNQPAVEFAGFPADARRIVAGATWRF